ncbi:MAG: gliding motility-associated protein GldE, partial [Flavobacteriaceae bacterium]|nr:gliding motility-associated protein GldE [Flavobacteriaceae bacterium]
MDPEPTSLFLLSGTIFTGIFIAKIVLLLFLLICSAFISGAEVAFFSLSQADLDEAAASKSKQQHKVVKLLGKPKKLLATILIINNFINILIVLIFAYLGEEVFRDLNLTLDLYFFELPIRFLLEVGLVTFLILLFGEVLPKVYASRNAMKFAMFMVVPITVFNFIVGFLSSPLLKMTNFIESKLGKSKPKFSVERLSQAFELTANNATTDEEHKILEGIVNFGNTDTIQIMKPRIDVFAISDKESFKTVISQIIKNGFSRNPVFHENIDDIIGVLYAKDLLPHLNKEKFNWKPLLREVIFVPENKKLDDLLKEFQEKKTHLAVVVDEYGGTSGIVTLEDIIEEI